MKNNKLFQAIKRTIISNIFTFLLLILLIVCSIIIALIPPLVLERIINTLTSRQSVSLQIIVYYFSLLALSGILDAASNSMITIFGGKLTHGIRTTMTNQLKLLPAAYYINNDTGKITSRFINDVDAIDSLFTNGIISMFADICKLISILVIIFIKSLGLGIIMLIILPLIFLLTRSFQKNILKAQIVNRKALSKVNNHIPETISCIRMIHSFFIYHYMEDKYDNYIQESYKAINKSSLYDSLYSPIIITTGSLIISIVMVMACLNNGGQAFFGIGVGTAVAIINYIGKVFAPIEAVGMEIQNIQSALAGIQRINDFLNEKTRSLPTEKITASELKTSVTLIEFKQVDFGYLPNQSVLHNFSLCINSGDRVTFVGRTGSGKSTIFRLLMGLYTPQKGLISIAGKQAKQIDDTYKRQLFGYVEQTFKPVEGTIGQQISLFAKNISASQITQAAKLVYLDEIITALPQGYDTPYSSNIFSQGQVQLLSIARAIVSNPPILLLDEITANLDSHTEAKVIAAIRNASKNRTILSISHRLYDTGMDRIINL